MPDAGRTRRLTCKKMCTLTHASNDRAAGTPGTPCAMGYGLYAVSSVHRAFWPPSPCVSLARLDPSVGGSGPHDFAVRIERASSCALDASIASRRQRS